MHSYLVRFRSQFSPGALGIHSGDSITPVSFGTLRRCQSQEVLRVEWPNSVQRIDFPTTIEMCPCSSRGAQGPWLRRKKKSNAGRDVTLVRSQGCRNISLKVRTLGASFAKRSRRSNIATSVACALGQAFSRRIVVQCRTLHFRFQ